MLLMSRGLSRATRFSKRSLLTVASWSAMALLRRRLTLTRASLGYTRRTRVVSGTTWTRFRYWFEASLLTITAARFFWISPPTEGPKLIHQTSPRFIADIPHRVFRPLQSFGFALLVSSHLPVSLFELLGDDVGAYRLLDEAADATPTYDCMQSFVNFLVDGNRQLLLHGPRVVHV